MVKLTAEVIEDSFQYINPIREYELNLRGYKISAIENLGATLNQFDTIDFSDNDIRRLDNFPLLTKLHSLLLNNNRIQQIADNLHEYVPNLTTLILTNNNVEDLAQIDIICKFKYLKTLSLIRNPIASLKNYRLYTIYKLPQLKLLDFKKIKLKERQEATLLFKGKKLKAKNATGTTEAKTFTPGAPLTATNGNAPIQPQQHRASKEELEAIRAAIQQVTSMEEMEQLSQMLKSGIIPDKYRFKPQQQPDRMEEGEDEEDDEEGNENDQQHQQTEIMQE